MSTTNPQVILPRSVAKWETGVLLFSYDARRDCSGAIRYADDVHTKSPELSKLLQRSLKKGRGKEIANYLMQEEQRLFNALVVAVYGGQPEWFAFDNLRAKTSGIEVADITPNARTSVGFLRLDGEEKLLH